MFRLIYISTARQMLSAEEREAVLRTSRRNNDACGVTGLLVIGGRRFLQALEGPEDAVRATYERIRHDPRHFAIVELSRDTIEERAFARWSMGYVEGGTVADTLASTESVEALISPITDPNVRGYFGGFAATQSPQGSRAA